MSIEITLRDRVVENQTFWDFKGEVDYVDEWFLMSSPVPILLTLLGYWSFVLKLGPEYMKNKPPFNMSSLLALYNVGQIGLSSYLAYIGTKLMLRHGFIHSSCLMDEETPRFMITSCFYAYFFAKLTELLDTVFFVLKKKYSQVTFLHVYHHSMMLCAAWLTLKYEPTYNIIFLGTINSYVHVIMYTYYGLSAFPELSKYLWWKKYITKMQITQFFLGLSQTVATCMFSECPPSYILLATIFLNGALFIGLFINFYVNSYKKKKAND